jgi:hypothetical protein
MMTPHQLRVLSRMLQSEAQDSRSEPHRMLWKQGAAYLLSLAEVKEAVAATHALVKSRGGFMYPRDLPADWSTKGTGAEVMAKLKGRMYVPWAPVLNTDALLVNSDSPRYAGVAGKPAEPPHHGADALRYGCLVAATAHQPLDLSGVTLDAEGWSSWIEAPEGGFAASTVSLLRTQEWQYRHRSGDWNGVAGLKYMWADITAIRIKARSASDTEGLPIGAVVRVWYDGMPSPEVPRYAMFGRGPLPWSRLMSTAEQAAGDRERITMSAFPGAVYLPIDVRSA